MNANNTITYGELQDQLGIKGPRPFLVCPDCGEESSAHAGDYWDRPKHATILCGHCSAPLIRVRRETKLVPA